MSNQQTDQANQFTVDYFIAKFEAIPDQYWITGEYSDGHGCCALGHCGETGEDRTPPPEACALHVLFKRYFGVSAPTINDHQSARFPGATPKARVLNALRQIKAQEESK